MEKAVICKSFVCYVHILFVYVLTAYGCNQEIYIYSLVILKKYIYIPWLYLVKQEN